ncbi:MAG: hypothetical protein QM766_09460 [Burkholderiaceae bacterium]
MNRRRWSDARVARSPSAEPFFDKERQPMRSILLYLLGIPIPIIILIALFVH